MSSEYWKIADKKMLTGRCLNCDADLLDDTGGDYAAFSCVDGVRAEIDEMGTCPACDWPLSENDEQLIRENADDQGFPNPYEAPLAEVHAFWKKNLDAAIARKLERQRTFGR